MQTLRHSPAFVLVLALAFSLPSPVRADDPPLERYSWLIGSWTGAGEMPGMGAYTDEYEYTWMPNRKFMRTVYVLRAGGQVVWTDVGMVGWDATRGCLVGFNFGMEGTIGWGRAISEEADSFLMEGRVVGPEPNKDFRVRMRRVGPDTLEMIMESKQGDAWVPQPAQRFTRKGAPAGLAVPPVPNLPPPAAAVQAMACFEGAWQADLPEGRLETVGEWVMNRNFLRRTESITDAAGLRQESVEWIGWNHEKQSLVVFAFGADGTTRTGTVTGSADALSIERFGDWLEGTPVSVTSLRRDPDGRLHLREETVKDGARAPVREATLLAAPTNERIKPLAWLVGEWTGGGKYGEQAFDESIRYEWTHNVNFLRWTAEARMEGQVVHSETGMLGWDSARKRLRWFSFSMDGTIGQAEDQASEEKDTWIALGNVGDQPPWHDTRQILRKVDPDTYTLEVQTKKDAGYETFFRGEYRRRKDK